MNITSDVKIDTIYAEAYVLNDPGFEHQWDAEQIQGTHIEGVTTDQLMYRSLTDAPANISAMYNLYNEFIDVFCSAHVIYSIREQNANTCNIKSVEYVKDIDGNWSYCFDAGNFNLLITAANPRMVLTHQEYELFDFITVSANSLKGLARQKLIKIAEEMSHVYSDIERGHRLDVKPQRDVITKTAIVSYLHCEFKREYEALLKLLARVGYLQQDSQRMIENRVVGWGYPRDKRGGWCYEIYVRDMSLLLGPREHHISDDVMRFKSNDVYLSDYLSGMFRILERDSDKYLNLISDMTIRYNTMHNLAMDFNVIHNINPNTDDILRRERIIERAMRAQ